MVLCSSRLEAARVPRPRRHKLVTTSRSAAPLTALTPLWLRHQLRRLREPRLNFRGPGRMLLAAPPVLRQTIMAARNRQDPSPHTTNSRSPSARITAPPTNSPPEPGYAWQLLTPEFSTTNSCTWNRSPIWFPRLRTTHYSTATGTAPSSRASSEPNNRALRRTHRSCPSGNPRRTTAPASRTTRQTISTHPMPRNRSSPALSAVLPRPSTPRLTMTHRSSTPQWFPASHRNTQSIYTHTSP